MFKPSITLSCSLIATTLCLGAAALGQNPQPAPAQAAATPTAPIVAPLKVVVSIPPLKGLIEPLLPPGSTIDVLIPPGVSEHGYEIPPARLAAIAQADIVVTIGLSLEPQVDKFLAGSSQKNATRRHVEFAKAMNITLSAEVSHDHVHGPDCDHGTNDPHMWLDPQAAKVLVTEASRQLIALRPLKDVELKDHPIRIAARDLLARLDTLDASYKSTIDAAPSKTIVVAHDAYGWLANRYNLTTIAIKGITAQEPKPADLARAMQIVREQKISTVFIEPQISPKASQRVAEATGAKIAILDPLGSGDYFRMMTDNLAALKAALNPSPATP